MPIYNAAQSRQVLNFTFTFQDDSCTLQMRTRFTYNSHLLCTYGILSGRSPVTLDSPPPEFIYSFSPQREKLGCTFASELSRKTTSFWQVIPGQHPHQQRVVGH